VGAEGPTVSHADVGAYWRRICRRGFRDTGTWVHDQWRATFGVVPAATWLVLWFFRPDVAWDGLAAALAALIVLIALGVVVLVVKTLGAPVRVEAERDAATEAERAALSRLLRDEEATVARLTALREPRLRLVGLGNGWLGGLPYRVGVENLSDVPVTNVTLRLVASVPGADSLPAGLRKTRGLATHVTINPHAIESYDVVEVPGSLNASVSDAPDTYEHLMWLCFADPQPCPALPVQIRTLRLEASGADTARPRSGPPSRACPRRGRERPSARSIRESESLVARRSLGRRGCHCHHPASPSLRAPPPPCSRYRTTAAGSARAHGARDPACERRVAFLVAVVAVTVIDARRAATALTMTSTR
jgi:hypothetical protein